MRSTAYCLTEGGTKDQVLSQGDRCEDVVGILGLMPGRSACAIASGLLPLSLLAVCVGCWASWHLLLVGIAFSHKRPRLSHPHAPLPISLQSWTRRNQTQRYSQSTKLPRTPYLLREPVPLPYTNSTSIGGGQERNLGAFARPLKTENARPKPDKANSIRGK